MNIPHWTKPIAGRADRDERARVGGSVHDTASHAWGGQSAAASGTLVVVVVGVGSHDGGDT